MFNQMMNSTSRNGLHHTLILDAVPENFSAAQEQVKKFLAPASCSMRTLLELDMLVEEIFINIASYAYSGKKGSVAMDLYLSSSNDALDITFRDSGIPYDPLKKESPDISSSAAERKIGGLGIFLVQKYSDGLSYQYCNGENQLTVHKVLA